MKPALVRKLHDPRVRRDLGPFVETLPPPAFTCRRCGRERSQHGLHCGRTLMPREGLKRHSGTAARTRAKRPAAYLPYSLVLAVISLEIVILSLLGGGVAALSLAELAPLVVPCGFLALTTCCAIWLIAEYERALRARTGCPGCPVTPHEPRRAIPVVLRLLIQHARGQLPDGSKKRVSSSAPER